MKTDRFSEIIRRKLESIRPEFTDKDWTRMQASLQQAMPPQPGLPNAAQPFSGGAWGGSPWLLAAATVSTVVLIAFSIWQRSEINDLQDTLGQLKKQPTPAQTQATTPLPAPEGPTVAKADNQNQAAQADGPTPAPDQKQMASGSRDTVYITRYVPAPAPSRIDSPNEQVGQSVDIPPKQREVLTGRTPAPTDATHPNNNPTTNPKTSDYGVTSTPSTNAQPNTSQSVATNNPATATRPSVTKLAPNYPVNKPGRTERGRTNDDAVSQSGTTTGNLGVSAGVQTERPADATTAATSARYELADSRPLATKTTNWNVLLAGRARGMRRPTTVVPATTETAKAPARQPVQQLAARPRVGVGTELSAHSWSAGLLTELPLNRHWMLSLGISQATYLGGLFITADDFDARTKRNFKQEFGRGLDPKLDPKGDILNVDTRMIRFQIPLSVSYRVPLSRTLTLMPSVGTYLNLSNQEKITFYYRQPLRGFDQANFKADRSVDLLTTMALSTGLEWQSRHWVVQASPVLTLPTSTDPGWQKTPMLSARARLLFQF